MFGGSFFGNNYFGPRYFAKAGADAAVGGGSFGGKFMIYDEDEEEWFQ